MEAQQEQIEQLRQQLQVRDSTIQQLQQQVDQDQTVVTEAEQKADAAASNGDAAVSLVRNQVSDLRSNEANTALRQEAQQSVSAPEGPLAIHFKGITLTPGGFLDATGIYRTHNENADGGRHLCWNSILRDRQLAAQRISWHGTRDTLITAGRRQN